MARTAQIVQLVGALTAALDAPGTGRTGRTERLRRAAGSVVRIPAGEFTMGTTPGAITRAVSLCANEPRDDDPDVVLACAGVPLEPGERYCQAGTFAAELQAHTVWLRAFDIDRTEVTVAAYQRCVSAGRCRPGLVSPGTPQLGGATQPVAGVTWDDAQAYCRWVGGRLPTEAEWERAARGRDGRPFPWGFQFDPRRANHGAFDAGCYATRDGHAFSAPVGSYPDGASPDGLLDMAGNVWEWVADLWDPDGSRYPAQPGARRVDPRGATHGASRIIRGGAYSYPPHGLRTTHRAAAGAGARHLAIGFRCAYDVAP